MKKCVAAIFSILLLCLALSGCLGPKPALQGYTATPPGPGSGDPFTVEAVVVNQGPGAGQVEVQVNLKNKQNGAIIAADSKDLDLDQNATQHVLFKIDLPPSAKDLDPRNIDVEVDAHYPIE